MEIVCAATLPRNLSVKECGLGMVAGGGRDITGRYIFKYGRNIGMCSYALGNDSVKEEGQK